MDDFDLLVEAAGPYADTAVDYARLAEEVAENVKNGGDPALFLTTQKNAANPLSFPLALQFHRRNPDGVSELVGSFDIERPDYSDNRQGFKGNHLVVAILRKAEKAISERVSHKIDIYTGTRAWTRHCASPGYFETKDHNAITNAVNSQSAPAESKRAKPGSI